MNKDEFVQFWMVFYDKFFKIDTNQAGRISFANYNRVMVQNLTPKGSIHQCYGSYQLFLCSRYGTFQESW